MQAKDSRSLSAVPQRRGTTMGLEGQVHVEAGVKVHKETE